MYPLCIDKSKKIGGTIHNFDRICGEITWVEGTTKKTSSGDGLVKSMLFLWFSRIWGSKLHNRLRKYKREDKSDV